MARDAKVATTAASAIPDRVAIVMLSAVGDVVHTMPVIHSLRAANPRVRITWVIQPGPAGLVKDNPAIDEFIVFDRKKGWRAFRDLRRAMRGRRFDLVLALQDYLKSGLIAAILPADRKLGIDRGRARDLNWLFTTERIPARDAGHLQDQYLEYVEHLGVPTLLEWGLDPTPGEQAIYQPLLPALTEPLLALVVGTSKAEKEWPAERYAALIDRVHRETGARVMIVGGLSSRENEAAEEIGRLAKHPPLDLRAWDLRRVAYLLRRADVLVSPDTGPLHLAVALGTPSVALMGYTNPKRYGPYRRFSELTIDAFGDPGENYPVSAPHRHGRMRRLEVEAGVAKVMLALKRYPRTALPSEG